MTAPLSSAEGTVLELVQEFGTLSVDRGSDHIGAVRALARRGLVAYTRGVVRRVDTDTKED